MSGGRPSWKRIEPDAAEAARLRQVLLGRSHGAHPLAATAAEGGRTVDQVAAAAGLGSGDPYEQAGEGVTGHGR